MKKTVVLVDDEEIIVKSMKQCFNILLPDYTFISFTEPEKALAFCENNPVDLMLTDVNMPSLSGFDLLKALHRKNIKPIAFVISGFYSNEHQTEFSALGDFNFFTKPVKLKDLAQAIGLKLEMK